MAKQRFNKVFETEEADSLIPRLEMLIRELQMQANRLRERVRELAQADDSLRDLDLSGILERYPELSPFAQRMSEIAVEIDSMGCLLRDIDQGLVDFPFRVNESSAGNEEIGFLCWQFGEPRVVAWHPIDGGFAGRRRLPGAPKLYLN